MSIIQYNNKESIINRMLKFAASHMGIRQIELLDPVIVLFIEALAEDIYKLSGEIDNIEGRMLDKLSNMLTPDITVAAAPAHAILHASSSEKENVIKKETAFYYRQGGSGRRAHDKKIYFHPVCNARIYNGDIQYFVHKGLFYSIEADQSKTLLARSRESGHPNSNSCWIGLRLDDSITSLKDMSFYFDFPVLSDKTEYLNLLPYTLWYLNGQKLDVEQGIYTLPAVFDNKDIKLFSDYDISGAMDESIRKKYDNHFLTIKGSVGTESAGKNFPDGLKDYYTRDFVSKFKQNLIWIEIKFPLSFKSEIIDTMQICINAFPVANKILRSRNADLDRVSQIVPLTTANNEFFLFTHSVSDSQGRHYYEIPYNDTRTSKYRTYSLRKGGCERYNSCDARDYMVSLTDLLNNYTTFSVNPSSDDYLGDISKQSYMLVNQLKRTIDEMKEQREVPLYLIVDELEGSEILFVKYWLTNSELANNINAGSFLDVSYETFINQESVVLMSSTIGGKRPPVSKERDDLYKDILTTREVIASKEDIISYCYSEFRDTIREVEVRNGIMTAENTQDGLVRTIDIYLTPHKELDNFFKNESSGEYFRQKLIRNSPQTFNYRVFFT